MKEGGYKPTPIGVLPRVSTILNTIWKGQRWEDYLKSHTKKKIDRVSNETSGLGTRIHKSIGDWIVRKRDKAEFQYWSANHKSELPYLEAFEYWDKFYQPKYIESEFFLYSKLGYCGTCDIIAIVDDCLCVIDIKTGKHLHDTMGLQLSAYKYAYEEMTNLNVGKVAVLQLKINGKFTYKEYPYEMDIFKKALDIFNWRNK